MRDDEQSYSSLVYSRISIMFQDAQNGGGKLRLENGDVTVS